MKKFLFKFKLKRLILKIAIFLLLVVFVKNCLFSIYYIPSSSMYPILKKGDFVLVSKFLYRFHLPPNFPFTSIRTSLRSVKAFSNPRYNEIAIFYRPDSITKFSFEDHKLMIKRVKGAPGDILKKTAISTTVNDEVFSIPSYYSQLTQRQSGYTEEYCIPDKFYFLIGDNSRNSYDSRYFGLVHEKNFIGRAEAIIWPWPPRWLN